MNIGTLVKLIKQNEPTIRQDGGSHPLETSKGVFSLDQDLYGDNSYTFYVLLISLFDRAIMNQDLHHISIEQQKLLEDYFKEAWLITPYEYDNSYPEGINYNILSKRIQELDNFLGSYFGYDVGRYAKYDDKCKSSYRKIENY